MWGVDGRLVLTDLRSPPWPVLFGALGAYSAISAPRTVANILFRDNFQDEHGETCSRWRVRIYSCDPAKRLCHQHGPSYEIIC
jgi:hypothetical protein